jgi:hypothetical protein
VVTHVTVIMMITHTLERRARRRRTGMKVSEAFYRE